MPPYCPDGEAPQPRVPWPILAAALSLIVLALIILLAVPVLREWVITEDMHQMENRR